MGSLERGAAGDATGSAAAPRCVGRAGGWATTGGLSAAAGAGAGAAAGMGAAARAGAGGAAAVTVAGRAGPKNGAEWRSFCMSSALRTMPVMRAVSVAPAIVRAGRERKARIAERAKLGLALRGDLRAGPVRIESLCERARASGN